MQSTRNRSSYLIDVFIGLLFAPAGVALLLQAITTEQSANVAPAERILSLALFVFCIELAHMASFDLKNVARLNQSSPETPVLHQPAHLQKQEAQKQEAQKQEAETSPLSARLSSTQPPNLRLNRFLLVAISTIVLEATGFYFSLYRIATGALFIIGSQLWFNLLAGVQLWPGEHPEIRDFGIKERLPVLVANLLGLSCVSLWTVPSLRLFSASGVLLLVVLFIIIKYALPVAQTTHTK